MVMAQIPLVGASTKRRMGASPPTETKVPVAWDLRPYAPPGCAAIVVDMRVHRMVVGIAGTKTGGSNAGPFGAVPG
jgi:hypothetical protein